MGLSGHATCIGETRHWFGICSIVTMCRNYLDDRDIHGRLILKVDIREVRKVRIGLDCLRIVQPAGFCDGGDDHRIILEEFYIHGFSSVIERSCYAMLSLYMFVIATRSTLLLSGST
jgi:hypothetical protein